MKCAGYGLDPFLQSSKTWTEHLRMKHIHKEGWMKHPPPRAILTVTPLGPLSSPRLLTCRVYRDTHYMTVMRGYMLSKGLVTP